jgi:hypothetical protein
MYGNIGDKNRGVIFSKGFYRDGDMLIGIGGIAYHRSGKSGFSSRRDAGGGSGGYGEKRPGYDKGFQENKDANAG